MQLLLTAYDATDSEALNRRMDSRSIHLEKISVLKKSGEFLFGGAILNDEGRMIGSMIVYEVPDRKYLDEKLKEEPYIYNRVWKTINIVPFRLANIE